MRWGKKKKKVMFFFFFIVPYPYVNYSITFSKQDTKSASLNPKNVRRYFFFSTVSPVTGNSTLATAPNVSPPPRQSPAAVSSSAAPQSFADTAHHGCWETPHCLVWTGRLGVAGNAESDIHRGRPRARQLPCQSCCCCHHQGPAVGRRTQQWLAWVFCTDGYAAAAAAAAAREAA